MIDSYPIYLQFKVNRHNHIVKSFLQERIKIIMRKILSISLSVILSLIISCSNIKAMQPDTQDITTENYYDELGNYYNSETGEYFQWNNTRSSAKSFSFKIHSFVASESFKLNTTKVKITCYQTKYVNEKGNTVSGESGKFTVNLRRSPWPYSNNIATFNAPIGSSLTKDLGPGFSTDIKYFIEIAPVNALSNGVYIEGSGEVICY